MTDTVSCHSCGHDFAKGDQFCPKCGTGARLGSATSDALETRADSTNPTVCGSCFAPMAGADRFCPKCGTERAEEATVVSHVSLRNAQAAHLAESTTGEFEILRQLGVGAMGSVYLARDIALSRKVAIKLIAANLLQDEAMVARFRLEAQTVASLRHPNIVNVHAVRQAEDLHYFVMDFIDGPALRSIVKAHSPLDVRIVQALLYQVGSALDYAHHRGRGVIHRDIKPANIMVDLEGDAFVTDFGISKIAESQTGLTQTGATIGTPEYMSPEQCRGETLTGASDQYALGIVAYEMLCGKTPFSGSQYFMMVAHTSEEPEPILEHRPDCPPHVAEAVHRMLAKRAEDRWPDLESAMTAMGGAPLGRKDPTRKRITALAGSTAEVRALDITAPLTPVPGGASAPGRGPGTTPDDTGPDAGAPEAATSVTVMGLPTRVEEGDAFTLSADVRGATQGSLPGVSVAWSSTDPSIAVVTGGRVQALRAGTAVVSASVGDVVNSVSVMVAEAAAALVLVEPASVHVGSGERASLRARVHDRQGRDLERSVRWLTSDASVVSVTPEGEVVATGSGVATVTAESGGVTGTVGVVVDEAGAKVPPPVAASRARPAYKHPAAIAAALLLVAAGSIFGAFNAGLLGGGATGGAATGDDGAGARAVADVQLLDLPPTLTTGDSVRLVATALDAHGDEVSGQTPTFSVDDASRGTVRNGWLVASAPGTLVLSASIGDMAWPVTLEVSEGTRVATVDPAQDDPPASGGGTPAIGGGTPAGGGADQPPAPQPVQLNVRVSSRMMTSGARSQALVDVLDGRSTPMPSRVGDVRWASNDRSVLTVDQRTGALSAVGAGQANLTATLGSITETVRMTVVAAAEPGPEVSPAATVTGIDLSAPSTAMDYGSSQEVVVNLRGPGGVSFPDRLSQVQLRTADRSILTVDGRRLEAVGVGSTEVEARLGALRGTLVITVQAPVRSVEIQGGNRSLDVGESAPLTGLVLGPASYPLTNPLTWSSNAPGIVAVDANGVITATGSGSADITAEADSVVGRIRVNVAESSVIVPLLPSVAVAEGLVDEYVAALNAQDDERVRTLHGDADEDRLENLRELMDQPGFRASRERVDRPTVQGAAAVATFTVTVSTRRAFGGSRNSSTAFRAEFSRSGGGWVLSSVVLVDGE